MTTAVADQIASGDLVRYLQQKLDQRLEPHDFYLIKQLAKLDPSSEPDAPRLLEDCMKHMRDSFHGAVFLWGDGTEGAFPSPRYPHDAPDFTMMSWNILCHR